MKKRIKPISILLIAILFSSCATVLGGKITDHQKRKLDGEPQRDVRVVALVADIILFWPFAVVDFATGAIYKPE